jgi:SAM-dependent methyltransferase
MERKYYEAYEDRYQQIHSIGLQWFYDDPSPIVMEIIQKLGIQKDHLILELGCGEGRDAHPLLQNGYSLLATDSSPAAIDFNKKKRPEYANHFMVLDCLNGSLTDQFDFIYAVAVVHMLVPDADRNAFYNFICDHLSPNGIALICTMGDGKMERQTDIRNAFDLQKRTHEQTGLELNIASTSCRMVSFSTFEKELKNNKLKIRETGITNASPDFPVLMYAVVKV